MSEMQGIIQGIISLGFVELVVEMIHTCSISFWEDQQSCATLMFDHALYATTGYGCSTPAQWEFGYRPEWA